MSNCCILGKYMMHWRAEYAQYSIFRSSLLQNLGSIPGEAETLPLVQCAPVFLLGRTKDMGV